MLVENFLTFFCPIDNNKATAVTKQFLKITIFYFTSDVKWTSIKSLFDNRNTTWTSCKLSIYVTVPVEQDTDICYNKILTFKDISDIGDIHWVPKFDLISSGQNFVKTQSSYRVSGDKTLRAETEFLNKVFEPWK